MPPSKILVDSGFLFALFDQENEKHDEAVLVADLYRAQFLIPYVVLTEVAFLFNRSGGVLSVATFLDRLKATAPQFEGILITDLVRIREIMVEYRDARLDFVDCCIMALSERLNIRQVCTFDRRDFSIFRPKHVSYLELLP